MEGGGLLSSSPPTDPIWIVVKGISDFADHERDGIIAKTRGPACQQAARFVLTALRWEESIHGTT
jgi:adenosylhomocysteine nucleosidase